jgi:hypothetical protein
MCEKLWTLPRRTRQLGRWSEESLGFDLIPDPSPPPQQASTVPFDLMFDRSAFDLT